MKYLTNIGVKAKNSYRNLGLVDHKKIVNVLNDYNKIRQPSKQYTFHLLVPILRSIVTHTQHNIVSCNNPNSSVTIIK